MRRERKTLQRAASGVVRDAHWELGRDGEHFCALQVLPRAQVCADRWRHSQSVCPVEEAELLT